MKPNETFLSKVANNCRLQNQRNTLKRYTNRSNKYIVFSSFSKITVYSKNFLVKNLLLNAIFVMQ